MGDMESNRRSLLMAAAPLLLAAVAASDKTGKTGHIGDMPLAPAPKTGPDPNETFTLPFEQMNFQSWGNLPPHSGEMAKLYGDFDQPGPIPGDDEMESGLVQRAAYLCNRPDPGRGVRHLVCQQQQ